MITRIVSVNCSLGRTVVWKDRRVQTGIFKAPVPGPVMVRKLNVDGDRQSDLKVHGGPDKAVYSYDIQDYWFWESEMDRPLPHGMFGENLTTEGLLDREVCVGDVLNAGKTVLLQATQPRLPCYKLGIKFQDEGMVRRFTQAGRWGVYFRVLEEGLISAGDALTFVSRDPHQVTIDSLARISTGQPVDPELIRRALDVPSLTPRWRQKLLEIAK